MKFLRSLYFSGRFFAVFGAIACIFAFSFVWPVLFPLAQALIVVAGAVVLADIFILYNPDMDITCSRHMYRVLSLGSENPIRIDVGNKFGMTLYLTVIDELPVQLQERKFAIGLSLEANQEKSLNYIIKPNVRGEYLFGSINIFVRSFIGLIERRLTKPTETMMAVYPSIIQMKQFELKTIARIASFHGIKKIRRIGHSYEFEQIKNYSRGDDFRSINWKATGRRSEIMVNQYEDEKAQQIYSLVDNSRSMRMPFDELSLLDYAINTSLVISNTALQKHDKAGLITFSEKIGTVIKADRGSGQLQRIMDGLYKEEPRNLEANYEMLYHVIRNVVKNRSLMFLYTNFESIYSLERMLPIIRRINKSHLLVVVFFENTQVSGFAHRESRNVEDIYLQTIAQKFILEKNQIIQRLRQFGIQSILTKPEDLSINTINKYLELKARGMI